MKMSYLPYVFFAALTVFLCACIQPDDGTAAQTTVSSSADTSSLPGSETIPPSVTGPEQTPPSAETGIVASPEDAIRAVFSAGNVSFSLSYDGTPYPSYVLNDSNHRDRFLFIPTLYKWEKASDDAGLPLPSAPTVFLLTSEDVSRTVRIYAHESVNILTYEGPGEKTFWTADIGTYPGNPARMMIEIIRRDYDNFESDYSRIRFKCDGDADELMTVFLTEALPGFLNGLEPESLFGIADYAAYGYNLQGASSDGTSVAASVRYYVIPSDPENTGWYGMNGIPGTGKYEGWLMVEQLLSLKKQEDGMWQYQSEFGKF